MASNDTGDRAVGAGHNSKVTLHAFAHHDSAGLPAKLDAARLALTEATTDFERLRVRDHAAAVQAAASILARREIQVEASILVTEAERAIANANPRKQGKRTDLNFSHPVPEVPETVIQHIRQAHSKLKDDADFDALKEEARAKGRPITRETVRLRGVAPEVLDEAEAKAEREGISLTRAGKLIRKGRSKDAKFSALTPQALPDGLFAVVYADPPWPLPEFVADTPRDVRNHYPTMKVSDIKAMDVGGMLARDAMLYLWVPTMFLPDGLDVMIAWGFKYSTNMVWVKPNPIMGIRVRGQHETLLVGMHGSFPPPGPGHVPASVFHSEKKETKHSRKPDYYYDLLDELYPGLAKVELFAREAREGWTAWGNEGVGQ